MVTQEEKKNQLVIHQTVSLVRTSHIVEVDITHFLAGSEKMQLGKGKQYWPTERQNIPFQDPIEATHLLQTFPKKLHCSGEIAEREHGSQALKVLTLSKAAFYTTLK